MIRQRQRTACACVTKGNLIEKQQQSGKVIRSVQVEKEMDKEGG